MVAPWGNFQIGVLEPSVRGDRDFHQNSCVKRDRDNVHFEQIRCKTSYSILYQ